jgi:hypothetical protein
LKKPTLKEYLAFLETQPDLTDYGWANKTAHEKKGLNFESCRRALMDSFEEFALCCELFSKCPRNKKASPNSPLSHSVATRLRSFYAQPITNGVVIAAVLYLGVPYLLMEWGPNIRIAFSQTLDWTDLLDGRPENPLGRK